MRTVADPRVLRSLKQRLGMLRPDSPRRWGTLTPHEMLCHLRDAAAMVLGTRPRTVPIPQRRRPIVKALALWAPIPWPHDQPTNPLHDPRAEGTRPSDFTKDLSRAIAAIEDIATAAPDALDPAHGCSARCRSVIGNRGLIGTRIITCVSSACEFSPLP